MPTKRFKDYSTEDKEAIAARIDRFLKKRSIPRKNFWKDAGIGQGTSEKLFIGVFGQAPPDQDRGMGKAKLPR